MVIPQEQGCFVAYLVCPYANCYHLPDDNYLLNIIGKFCHSLGSDWWHNMTVIVQGWTVIVRHFDLPAS